MRKFYNKFNKRIYMIGLFILALIAVGSIDYMQDQGCSIIEAIGLAGGGLCMAIIPIFDNIDRVGDRVTSGRQIHYRIYYIHEDQIDRSKPFPKPNANREIGTIPLVLGQFMHYLECIDYSVDDKSTSSKGDITSTVDNTIAFNIGGFRKTILNFIEKFQGDAFYLILVEMDTGIKRLYGREYTPMIMKQYERSNGKDSRSTSITFANASFDQPLDYVGTIALEPPIGIAADATTLDLTAGKNFVASNANTVATVINAFTGIGANDEGRIINIKGGGGAYPTSIADCEGIILRGGLEWVGNADASITLKVFDATTLMEVDRA